MDITAIGTARGIFEIFIPGLFLILNTVAVIYALLGRNIADDFFGGSAENWVILAVLFFLSYLAGTIIRLFKTDIVDTCARWWLRNCPWRRRAAKSGDCVDEEFPYIKWLGATHTFPLGKSAPEIQALNEFYGKLWEPQAEGMDNRVQKLAFFNFCKSMINSRCERSANEIYTAEALSRFLTGMFYSLIFSLMVILAGIYASFIIELIQPLNGLIQRLSRDALPLILTFGALFLLYLALVMVILTHYRFIRIREVSIVFNATFRFQDLFEPH